MTRFCSSRREVLGALSGVLAAGGLKQISSNPLGTAFAHAPIPPPSLIDVHLHIVSSRLPRLPANAPAPAPFDLLQQPRGNEQLGKLISQELQAGGVSHALCMPTAVVSDEDPLGIEPALSQAAFVQGAKLYPIGVAHPERFDSAHLEKVDAVLKQGQVKALKIFLGYFHYSPLHAGYRPYYQLAAKHNIPIIFHTGDTYSQIAKVKFAHPLQIDEVAVDFPDTRFVLAHFGNPWILDAAQVVYKNRNVWADVSAILIGDAAAFQAMEKSGVLEHTAKRIREGIEYSEAPERFLFGSDWPLSSIQAYRKFVEQMFPREQLPGVLSGNAKALFRL